jgi:glycosyltransferase involved in cell wall biosynthesis
MRTNDSSARGARQPSDSLKVLYVGVQDLTYPRNSRVRNYLERDLGASIDVLSIDKHAGYWRHLLILLSRGLRGRRLGHYDVVVLAELSVVFAPASWLIARLHRATHVVDFFVGLYETHIEDRGAHHPFSWRAMAYRLFDKFAIATADLLLTDTTARASLWRKGDSPVLALPVGAPDWARPQPAPETIGRVAFLYYGNYIPLHGVPQVLEATALLRQTTPLHLTLVGTGEHRDLAERMVEKLGLSEDTTFIDYVPQEQLPSVIAQNNVVFGTFGTSRKATTVIANKVWQGLASGRAVVTGPGRGIEELLPLVPDRLFVSASVDPRDIAVQMERAAKLALNDQRIDHTLENYVHERFAEFGSWLGGR